MDPSKFPLKMGSTATNGSLSPIELLKVDGNFVVQGQSDLTCKQTQVPFDRQKARWIRVVVGRRVPRSSKVLDTIEFSLNDFRRIRTKSKNGLVSKDITYLASNTLPVLVIKSAFPLLSLVRYPFLLITQNRHHPRDTDGIIFFDHCI